MLLSGGLHKAYFQEFYINIGKNVELYWLVAAYMKRQRGTEET